MCEPRPREYRPPEMTLHCRRLQNYLELLLIPDIRGFRITKYFNSFGENGHVYETISRRDIYIYIYRARRVLYRHTFQQSISIIRESKGLEEEEEKKKTEKKRHTVGKLRQLCLYWRCVPWPLFSG